MGAELIITTDIEAQGLKAIDFNFDELSAWLDVSLEKYKGLVVSEDGIKDAKEDRAKLNKLAKAIDKRKIEIKKQCMAPYEAFETKVKQLTGAIAEVSGGIDAQIKAFEQAEKQKKREQIEVLYEEIAGDFSGLVTLERFWNEKWLNATVSPSAVEKELQEAVFKAKKDIQMISTIGGEYEQAMMDKYLSTLDMTAALAEKARLEEQAKAAAEYKRRIAEAKQAEAPKTESIKEMLEHVAPIQEAQVQAAPHLQTFALRFTCTMEKARALRAFIDQNGIQYEKVVG